MPFGADLKITEKINRPVAGNTAKPGAHLGVIRIVGFRPVPDPQEHVLSDLFGALVVVERIDGYGENQVAITVVKFAKRSLVLGGYPLN